MIYQKHFFAMGCQIFVAIDSDTPNDAQRLDQVQGWFRTWEDSFSRFIEDSELNRVNRNAGIPTKISQPFLDVLLSARQGYEYSDHLVTPTLRDALEAVGYDRSFEQLLPIEDSTPKLIADNPLSMDKIEIDFKNKTINLPKGTHLDFGGIAKGWAAHTAMNKLKIYGPTLVNAGGDIAISGLLSHGNPWEIGIINPFQPEKNMGSLHVGRCGVATSGQDYRRWQKGGQWQHHIIDPRTNLPAKTDLMAVTILAPHIWEAEVAAKTVFILGSKQGLSWLDSHPNLAGLLTNQHGNTIASTRLTSYIRSQS